MKDNSQDVNLFGKVEEQFSHIECHFSATQECNSISPISRQMTNSGPTNKWLTVG